MKAGFLLTMLLGTAAMQAQEPAHLGFDRNGYPGDAALPALRKSFSYTGYWLNNPPGEQRNSWVGKRALLRGQGFGFLVLFNGRLDAQLKKHDAAALGNADGKAAAAAASHEGFAPGVLIFLDQEEGGRLLPEQLAYLFAWIDAVRRTGMRAGVYCSGIEVPEGRSSISTARDILTHEQARHGTANTLPLWIANDACPPSPGCARTGKLPSAGFSPSLAESAVVWQYAQSPRRVQFSAACPQNAAPDGNCYAPGLPHSTNSFVDLNTAKSADPSETP